MSKVVYVGIGNSDDRLTQYTWSCYVRDVRQAIESRVGPWNVHGEWMSLPDQRWQNACWCFDLDEKQTLALRNALIVIKDDYDQEWISWAEAETEAL